MTALLDSVLAAIAATDHIKVATLFGSHARRLMGGEDVADRFSDVDIQIITTEPAVFENESWFRALAGQDVKVSARRQVFGGVQKFTILYASGELDCVVVPFKRLQLARRLYRWGVHRRVPFVKRGLMNFTDLMRFSHLVVKGDEAWKSFYRQASAELPRIGLDDEEVRQSANAAYVDAVAALARIERGELLAARRLLFLGVLETNLALVHEWRERRGLRAYHRARRAEQLMDAAELAAIGVEVDREAAGLRASVREGVAHCAHLVEQLLGKAPGWPPLPDYHAEWSSRTAD